MKKLLLILLCALPLRCLGAAGDVTGISIETNGWMANIYIEGVGTNGTFALGLATNNTITGGQKLILSVVSQGYNADGTATTRSRALYGTARIRFPFPSDAYPDVVTNGGIAQIKVALSDEIYAGDSNITASVLAGLYTSGSANSAASAVAVTNLSTVGYRPVIANWSMRGYRVIDSEQLDLRAQAFHGSARDGKPVAGGQFVVTVQGTNHTNFVTAMQIDRTYGDALPVPEYIGNFPTNTLGVGLAICNAKFWPWIGDASTIADSSLTAPAQPSVYFEQLTNAVNYARVRALVNSTTGTDASGIAADETFWATNTSPSKFKTIGGAIKAIYDTNNASYSRAGFGGGIVLLEDGNHTNFAATATLANGPTVECILTPASGATKAGVIMSAQGTDTTGTTDRDLFRWKGFTLDTASNTLLFNPAQVWLDDMDIPNATGAALFQNSSAGGAWIITRSVCSNITQGIRGNSSQNFGVSLFRGNRITGNITSWHVSGLHTGNWKTTTGTNTLAIFNDISSGNVPRGSQFVYSYNRVDGVSSSPPTFGATYALTNGAALVNNEFIYSGSGGQTYSIFSADSTSSTNALVWHNLFKGARTIWMYNDTGSATEWRVGVSLIGNEVSWFPIKSDNYIGVGNSNRVGNWEAMWSTASGANAFLNTTNIFNGNFDFEFTGIGSYFGNYTSLNFPEWRNSWGWDGVTLQTNGVPDHRLGSFSPLWTQIPSSRYLLPYDLDGVPRGKIDPPGPYVSGNPRKGALF